jgi:CRP/FNR family transcriptional regulator, cyclic AMP receptor protein
MPSHPKFELVEGSNRRSESKLASLAPEEWEGFNKLAPLLAYPPEIGLFEQGSRAQDVYLIERGLVKLSRIEENGQELIVGLRFQGWLLSADAVITQEPCPMTAVTVTKCHLRRIHADEFTSMVQNNHEFSWYLHRINSREILEHICRMGQLTCLEARLRLEHLLWHLLSILGLLNSQQEIRLQLPLKHWEIAMLIAVTPTYLSRLLNELEHDGTIRRSKGWLIIPDHRRFWHRECY